MRVYELAKQLGVSSKSLLSFIREKAGIEVKSHMSNLTDEQVEQIKEKLPSKEKKEEKKEEKKKKKRVEAEKKQALPEKGEERSTAQGQKQREETEIKGKETEEKPLPERGQEKESKAVLEEEPAQEEIKEIELELPCSLREFAEAIGVKPNEILLKAMANKKMLNINTVLDDTLAEEVGGWFGVIITRPVSKIEKIRQEHEALARENAKPRHAVVTLMGHVDHGKTSLLDFIRKSNVTDKEYGGITQHIGAYVVQTPHGKLTFLDTPGHEAFTEMRARGANATDIVILVVAADDGVMPQTIEALNHAKAASVPIVVAINKVDKSGVDVDKVKRQLMEHGLMPEEWGGKTIMVPVSAKTGQGIDELLEMVILEAEMLELKTNYDKPAHGVVLEAQLHPFKGVVATLLVQSGRLRVGDAIIVGDTYGKIKSITNDRGQRIKELLPSEAGEVLGIEEVPLAGDMFFVVGSEKEARRFSEEMSEAKKKQRISTPSINLESIFDQIQKGEEKELRLILKADVQGTLEAIKSALERLSTNEVKVRIMHAGVGEIGHSDALLAEASKAVIIGFNVGINSRAKKYIEEKKLEVRIYKIIYELIDQIKAAIEGMLEPIIKEVWIGTAEVRQVFKLSKAGVVAGSYVKKGKIVRGAKAKLVRNGQEVWSGTIVSLKRFKDDVREVAEGYECGISLSNFNQIMVGDNIEAFQEEKILRKLK